MEYLKAKMWIYCISIKSKYVLCCVLFGLFYSQCKVPDIKFKKYALDFRRELLKSSGIRQILESTMSKHCAKCQRYGEWNMNGLCLPGVYGLMGSRQ